MTWIAALWASQTARKAIIYGAVGLGILFGVRYYSNRVWSEGYEQGKTAGAREMEVAKKAEWAAKEKAIQTATADLEAQRSVIGAQSATLAQARRDLQAALKTSLDKISTTAKVNNATAIAVPDDSLDDAIRAISAELAASQP